MPSVEEIIITPELFVRPAHQPDALAETAAIRRLSEIIDTDPEKTLQVCAELALELCDADTCGISLLERTGSGEEVFRWVALSGTLKDYLNGTTPRFYSPCGICIDTATPLLMRRPELVYSYLDIGPPIYDALLIPMNDPGQDLEGTIWVIAHDPQRQFDLEHARVMQRIAVFTASALHLLDPELRLKVRTPLAPKVRERIEKAVNEPAAPEPEKRIFFSVDTEVGSHAELRAEMRLMREWLDHRRFEPVSFRYSSGPSGFILRVQFGAEAQARAFAAEFNGRVIAREQPRGIERAI